MQGITLLQLKKNYKKMLEAGAKDTTMLKAYEKISDAVIAVLEQNKILDHRLTLLEQSISKAVPIDGYCSVKEYLSSIGKFLDTPRVASIGKACTAYCNSNKIEIRKTTHEFYSYRNTYPVSVIKMFV